MWDEMDSDDEIFKPKKVMTDQEVEETCEYLRNHPFTMNSLPEDNKDNPLIEALSQLKYDDTPENVAKDLNVKN